jgi:hypothetical protein
LQQSYPAIKAPSLFLWAGRDKHFPVAHGRELGALVPKAQVEEIPEAEHWMALYLAEQVSARISRFLGTSDAGWADDFRSRTPIEVLPTYVSYCGTVECTGGSLQRYFLSTKGPCSATT